MGSTTERQLMKEVQSMGWEAMRAPASGAGGTDDNGDVWIGRMTKPLNGSSEVFTDLHILEEKYKGSRYISVQKEKADGMIETAVKLGATPGLAVKWDGRKNLTPESTHYIIDIREIERTNAGNISLNPDQIDDFQTVEEYFR